MLLMAGALSRFCCCFCWIGGGRTSFFLRRLFLILGTGHDGSVEWMLMRRLRLGKDQSTGAVLHGWDGETGVKVKMFKSLVGSPAFTGCGQREFQFSIEETDIRSSMNLTDPT
jgi:hypothetical protein